MENSYYIKQLDSFDEWAEMSTSWNDLLMKSSANSIFLTWEWLYSWGECFLGNDRKLHLIVFYKNNELIGIAPFYSKTVRKHLVTMKHLGFLGSPETASDYLDIFTIRGKEKEVAMLLYNYLFSEKSHEWDSMLLRDMPSDSLFLMYFIKNIRRNGKYYDINESSYCPQLILDNHEEHYFEKQLKKRQKRLRYDLRVLERSGDVEHNIIQAVDVDDNLRKCFSLHKERWGNSKSSNPNIYMFLEIFIERCKKYKWVNLELLKINGQEIASLLLLEYNNTLSMYLMAVDTNYNSKISVGNIITGLSIEKAIVDGNHVYDFLKGDEEYKFYWSKEGKRCMDFLTYRRNYYAIIDLLIKVCKVIYKIIFVYPFNKE